MIDELDRKLIGELQEDGRQTYSELAKILGVTEGAVRKRLKSLIKGGIIKVVAVPNIKGLGYDFTSIVAIQVRMAKLDKVLEELSNNPTVCQLAWVTGRYDLIAVVITRSREEFANFMVNELSRINGVVRTETFVTLGMSKGEVYLPDMIQLIGNLNIPPRKRPPNKRKQD